MGFDPSIGAGDSEGPPCPRRQRGFGRATAVADGRAPDRLEAAIRGLPLVCVDPGGRRQWLEQGLRGRRFPDEVRVARAVRPATRGGHGRPTRRGRFGHRALCWRSLTCESVRMPHRPGRLGRTRRSRNCGRCCHRWTLGCCDRCSGCCCHDRPICCGQQVFSRRVAQVAALRQAMASTIHHPGHHSGGSSVVKASGALRWQATSSRESTTGKRRARGHASHRGWAIPFSGRRGFPSEVARTEDQAGKGVRYADPQHRPGF